MDVRLSVWAQNGRRPGRARGENERPVLTLGKARPPDQALQQATTGMLRWPQGELNLDARAAHCSRAMMLERPGVAATGRAIESAIAQGTRTGGLGGVPTTVDIGIAVAARAVELARGPAG